MAWKERALLALIPRSFGPGYRRAVLDSVEEALADAALKASGRGHTPTGERARVWFDFFKTAAQERATATWRIFNPRRPQIPRSPRRESHVSSLLSDIRYAVRSLARSPGFALVAIATIALGIGANAAIFSVVNSLLLRPLPFEDPDRLVMVRGRWPARGVEKAGISTGNLADFIRDTAAFDEFAALTLGAMPVSDGTGGAEQVRVGFVTPNFFSVLGIDAALGRTVQPGDSNETVVISDELWRRRFGGDPEVLGKTLQLGDPPSTIVGVLPPGLIVDVPEQVGVPTTDTQVWKVNDWDLDPDTANRRAYFLRVFARLKPGATLVQAQQEADAVAAYSRENFADAARVNTQFDVLTVHSQVVDTVFSTLVVFMAAVGFVLLIACANVANLLLVRSKAREREIAVRAALGAGRARVLRQMLLESLVLAVAGAAGGVLIAYAAVRALLWLDPAELPRLHALSVDTTVLFFSLALALATAVVFGLLPALHAAGASISTVLRQGGLGSTGVRKRLGRALIIAEVAMSLILLVGAGLLARSFFSLSRVSPGFATESALTFRAGVPPDRYHEFVDEVGELPGVTGVAGMSRAPLSGSPGRGPFVPDTIAEEDTASWPASLRTFVTPGYFEAMGIGLVDGRSFEERDLTVDRSDDFAGFAIVDRRLAERVWAAEGAVGRTLLRRPINQPEGSWRVVGVVESVHHASLRESEPGMIYYLAPTQVTFIVKTVASPESLVQPVRAVLAAIAPGTPVHEVRTLESYVAETLAPERFTMILAAVFGGAALLLAAVGMYGVISYAVSQRMREMGVRMALGAQGMDVTRLVVGEGVKVTLVGTLMGLMGALVVSHVLAAWLFAVTPVDPLTYGAVTAVLLLVSVVACYVPARRASRADPMVTLRGR